MNERAFILAAALACMTATPDPEIYARQEADRKRRALEEAARHPATRSKPKSESLMRLLGKKRRAA